MSTKTLDEHESFTCERCKRRYNADVYKRHIDEKQCVKRNQRRLPFESIKQRSIRIGEKVFSVQRQQQSKNNCADVPAFNHEEKRRQTGGYHEQYQERIRQILPSNHRRRTLEQAKHLLERRTKYQPPWIKKRAHSKEDSTLPLNRTILPKTKDLSNNHSNQQLATKKASQKFYSRERPLPPTTKFKNDDLPIKVFDHQAHSQTFSPQPILTHSPKVRTFPSASQYPSTRMGPVFVPEQASPPSRPLRKAYTWTRASKPATVRDALSPIRIPTFREPSIGRSDDRITLPFNHNHDDSDEFERFSPTPPSTPKYRQERIEILSNVKQPTVVRPTTYQKAKRSDLPQTETLIQARLPQIQRKSKQATFHLPPINLFSYPKLPRRSTINPTPWR